MRQHGSGRFNQARWSEATAAGEELRPATMELIILGLIVLFIYAFIRLMASFSAG